MSIAQNLSDAQRAYTVALAALDTARTHYLEGPGRAYQELLDRQADLRGKIATHTATADQAEETFKRLFATANYIRTKEVKAALFDKNDALSMADELGTALEQVQAESVEPRLEASSKARAYLAAYDSAYRAYAYCEAWKMLQEHGEPVAQALALLVHAPVEGGVDRLSADVTEIRTEFVWKALRGLATQQAAWGSRPTVAELGPLKLGPFANRAFVTPAEASQVRAAAGQSASYAQDRATERAEEMRTV